MKEQCSVSVLYALVLETYDVRISQYLLRVNILEIGDLISGPKVSGPVCDKGTL
jgi:hypothetical protein